MSAETADKPLPYLSPTFQSSALHTPLDVQRQTISDPNYSRYLASVGERTKADQTEEGRQRNKGHQWGRHWSYGGIGSNVPHEFTQFDPYGRPFGIRGHDHWSTGASVLPRDVPVNEEYYQRTQLKKNSLRPNDELVPRPLSVNMGKFLITKPFPADHPFTSHTLQRDLFPDVKVPPGGVLDEDTGLPSTKHLAMKPAATLQSTVRHKTRGGSARHEKLILFSEADEAAANKDRPRPNDVWDVDRTQRHRRALTYPAPQVLHGTRPEQRLDMIVRPRTANALANMKDKAYMTTSYQQQHTGRGPRHIANIDDYEEKQEAKEFATAFPEDRSTSVGWEASWKPGEKMQAGKKSGLKPASAVSRNSGIPPAQFGGDGYLTGYHVAKPKYGRNSRSAALNLKVEDPATAEEYGEMTAEGHMRPGTASVARCRSAGTVRFGNDPAAVANGGRRRAGSAKRPSTPWVKRPGTGRYRPTDSDDEEVGKGEELAMNSARSGGGGGNDEESSEEEEEDGGSTAGYTPRGTYQYRAGDDDDGDGGDGGRESAEGGLDNRQRPASRYDTTDFADGWKPNVGVPRPRSTYHERQMAFSKSAVMEQVMKDFPEKHPDLRDNQRYPGGKRHTFSGYHSYWWHHG